jgi:hypothetical protein
MKTKKNIFFIAMALFFAFVSCSKDDNKTDSPNSTGGSFGTFVGNLQITDDPQTNLGYVYNAKVTVITSGTNGTIKITGNEGFDREYTGEVVFSNSTSAVINIKKQTKPVDKIAGSNMAIDGNNLAINISLADDKVTVRKSPTATTTFEIAGKINMLGSGLLKQ